MGQSVVASLGLDDAATFRPIRRRRFDRRPTRVDIGSGTNPGKTPEDRTGGAGVRGHQRPVVAECDGPRPRHRLHLGAKMVGRVGDMLPIVVRKQDYRRCPVCVDAGRAGGLPVRSDALRYQGAQDHRAGRHKYDEQLRLVLLAASHGFFGLSIGAREWHVQPGCGSLCLAKKSPNHRSGLFGLPKQPIRIRRPSWPWRVQRPNRPVPHPAARGWRVQGSGWGRSGCRRW